MVEFRLSSWNNVGLKFVFVKVKMCVVAVHDLTEGDDEEGERFWS